MTEQEQDENLKKSLDLIRQWGEENKPPTLYQIIRDELGFSHDLTYEIIDAVSRWLPKEHDTNPYDWNRCVRMLREKLE
jgi:hypothetical protein